MIFKSVIDGVVVAAVLVVAVVVAVVTGPEEVEVLVVPISDVVVLDPLVDDVVEAFVDEVLEEDSVVDESVVEATVVPELEDDVVVEESVADVSTVVVTFRHSSHTTVVFRGMPSVRAPAGGQQVPFGAVVSRPPIVKANASSGEATHPLEQSADPAQRKGIAPVPSWEHS